jgi:hypothetical protein
MESVARRSSRTCAAASGRGICLFERDQTSGSGSAKSASTFVVNRDELGRSVAASIELVHQQ